MHDELCASRMPAFQTLSLFVVVMCTPAHTFSINSWVMGYHEYQDIWTPREGDDLNCRMQPHNRVDKYAVAVYNNRNVVGHLPLGPNGKFAKTIFFFLKAHRSNTCTACVKGKAVNLGKGKGMQVPCRLQFTGDAECLNLLKIQLAT